MLLVEVVGQASRCADDDVGSGGQGALLAANVHAADAGEDAPAGLAQQPRQLALDLQRQFARGRHDQGQGMLGPPKSRLLAEQGFHQAEAIGHGFA